jgi:hypothetical protein
LPSEFRSPFGSSSPVPLTLFLAGAVTGVGQDEDEVGNRAGAGGFTPSNSSFDQAKKIKAAA